MSAFKDVQFMSAREKERVHRRTCYCGSSAFKASITIQIADVPVWFSKEGALTYDDMKGESQGWDTDGQPEVACVKCGHLFDIERTGDPIGTAYLKGKEVGDAE